MKDKTLLKTLRHQAENLNDLLKTVLQKQVAIVSNNIDEIEKTTAVEEKLLLDINQTEKIRVEYLDEFHKKNLNGSASYKIADFFSFVQLGMDKEEKNELTELRNIIKEKIGAISRVNQQNKYLITQSRNLLNEIVSAIFSERNHSILDRKV